MPNLRAVLLAAVVAPVLSWMAVLGGGADLAGVLTGLAAGLALRGAPVQASAATLYGGAAAAVLGEIFARGDLAGRFADTLAGWPGWVAGALFAYLIAARGTGGDTRARRPGGVAAPVWAAAISAVLACTLLVAARAAEVTLWVEYHYYDGPGWYRDLTRATWYPAASVVVAAAAAARMPGGRGRVVALPAAAWAGCALTAGPLQYVQALGVPDRPAAAALLASLAGGGIGAVAAAAALRHAGVAAGLVSFAVLHTVRGFVLAPSGTDPALDLVVPAAVVAAVSALAARTASREPAPMPGRGAVTAGIFAGVAGPLLVWSVHLTIGPRLYDHVSQSWPYWLSLLTTPPALIVALVAAALAARAGPPAVRRPR